MTRIHDASPGALYLVKPYRRLLTDDVRTFLLIACQDCPSNSMQARHQHQMVNPGERALDVIGMAEAANQQHAPEDQAPAGQHNLFETLSLLRTAQQLQLQVSAQMHRAKDIRPRS